MHACRIRPRRPDDDSGLRRIIVRGHSLTPSWGPAPTADLLAWLDPPPRWHRVAALVATVDETVVGHVAVWASPTVLGHPGDGVLERLFVDSGVRRRGIGRDLVVAAHAIADAHDLSVHAAVPAHHVVQELFFTALGWQPDRTEAHAELPAGDPTDPVWRPSPQLAVPGDRAAARHTSQRAQAGA